MFPSDPLVDIEQANENDGQQRSITAPRTSETFPLTLSSHLSLLDISQVQCIKSYQAQEHDELTLEKADILHAKTITSDGKNPSSPLQPEPRLTEPVSIEGSSCLFDV